MMGHGRRTVAVETGKTFSRLFHASRKPSTSLNVQPRQCRYPLAMLALVYLRQRLLLPRGRNLLRLRPILIFRNTNYSTLVQTHRLLARRPFSIHGNGQHPSINRSIVSYAKQTCKSYCTVLHAPSRHVSLPTFLVMQRRDSIPRHARCATPFIVTNGWDVQLFHPYHLLFRFSSPCYGEAAGYSDL